MHQEICKRCNGEGTIKCKRCDGTGEIMDVWSTKDCPDCHGRGRLPCPAPRCEGGIIWVRDRR